jgi:predicted ribosomally synthesized peptide with SipW-like signal peptide
MKKLLFSLMAVILCVGIMGSAFAYFTDVETSVNNNLQAGTLNMKIADIDEGWQDGTPASASIQSPAGWAPGQSFVTDPISFQNAGTINIRYIFGRFCNLAELDGIVAEPEGPGSVNDISNYIVFESYLEKANGSGGFYEETFDTSNANAYLAFWGLPTKGYITLADLVYVANPAGSSWKTGLWFFDGGNDPTNPPLPVGGTAQIKFKFKLLESTPNAYQGDSANFRIDFIGVQTEANLDSSITEVIGPLTAP